MLLPFPLLLRALRLGEEVAAPPPPPPPPAADDDDDALLPNADADVDVPDANDADADNDLDLVCDCVTAAAPTRTDNANTACSAGDGATLPDDGMPTYGIFRARAGTVLVMVEGVRGGGGVAERACRRI
jgi:hypothetical protein